MCDSQLPLFEGRHFHHQVSYQMFGKCSSHVWGTPAQVPAINEPLLATPLTNVCHLARNFGGIMKRTKGLFVLTSLRVCWLPSVNGDLVTSLDCHFWTLDCLCQGGDSVLSIKTIHHSSVCQIASRILSLCKLKISYILNCTIFCMKPFKKYRIVNKHDKRMSKIRKSHKDTLLPIFQPHNANLKFQVNGSTMSPKPSGTVPMLKIP